MILRAACVSRLYEIRPGEVYLPEAVAGSGLRVLKIRNARLLDSQPSLDDTGRNLEELSETEVFSRCLAARKIEGAQADLLMRLYGEILTAMHETDSNAE